MSAHRILVTVGAGIRYDGAEMAPAENAYNLLVLRGEHPVRLSVDGHHRRGPLPEGSGIPFPDPEPEPEPAPEPAPEPEE